MDDTNGDPRRALVLASTSPYRRELLARLGLDFEQRSPGVDEEVRDGEAPAAMAGRLALAKARAVAIAATDAIVIGSDQVAELDGQALGKPGTARATVDQLLAARGRSVVFHTGLAVIDSRQARELVEIVPFTVRFRALTRAQIEAYVAREPALDCAGGFRAEALGIALFAAMSGDDPTALIGLPLIRLTALLAELGVDVLSRPYDAR